MKILNVVGARPNFMKIAPIVEEMKKVPDLKAVLVHTGQHYDEGMSDVFFRDLGIPVPDVHLGVGSGTHAEQTARIMVEFEKVCVQQKADLVVVVGELGRGADVGRRRPCRRSRDGLRKRRLEGRAVEVDPRALQIGLAVRRPAESPRRRSDGSGARCRRL